MINAKKLAGSHNFILITLDTLRFDIAQKALREGKLPNLTQYFSEWEKRHSPGSFTYAAHQAFFAGFLPTPSNNPYHKRMFALAFNGSTTTDDTTLVFNTENIVKGFKSIGYFTLCVGGVGFFNKLTPLGRVIPDMFEESHWDETFGVTDRCSTANQVDFAINTLERKRNDLFFLFMNVSAIHQPNYFYRDEVNKDDLISHQLALEYVDQELRRLFDWISQQKNSVVIITSDHGTTYGEDSFFGHRLAHSNVWNVPYAEFILSKRM